MLARLIASLASLAIAIPLVTVPVFAAGGGSSGSGGSTVQCKKGQVYDKRKKKCALPGRADIDDDSIYETGRALAMAGRYDEAISILSFAHDKTDPRILNYLGYSHRKAGRVLVGLGYYQEALRNNPDYTLVREYLGEAHLQLGNVAAARAELVEIEKRCGKSCSEYGQLEAQIDAFVKG
jgi:tetratricopeptide (TPR) repeat protein